MYFLSSVCPSALPQGLFSPQKYTYINREPLFLYLKYIKHVLSKLCATKCAPAGAFFPPKIHRLYFINRESLFLCFKYIKYVLSKLGVSKCAPAGFFPAKIHLLYFINRESLFLCLRYIKHVLSKLGATTCAPAGPFFPTKNTPSIFYK